LAFFNALKIRFTTFCFALFLFFFLSFIFSFNFLSLFFLFDDLFVFYLFYFFQPRRALANQNPAPTNPKTLSFNTFFFFLLSHPTPIPYVFPHDTLLTPDITLEVRGQECVMGKNTFKTMGWVSKPACFISRTHRCTLKCTYAHFFDHFCSFFDRDLIGGLGVF